MPRHQRKPAEKRQQGSLPACERTNKLGTRENYYRPGQSREVSYRRTRHSKEVNRVLLWIVYTQNNRGSQGARCPSTNQQWQLPYPTGRSWSCSKITEERQVGRVDNIPSELVQAGGEAITDLFLIICNKIWQTGEWPTPWTQSLIITLPKRGNLRTMPKLPYHQPDQSSK